MPSNPAGHLLQRLIEIGRRNTLRGDVRFGVDSGMSAAGEKRAEADWKVPSR